MSRKYTHIQSIESEIVRLQAEGYTQNEIAERFGLDKIQVKNALYRYRKRVETSPIPKRRGRPRKKPITDWKTMERELDKLRMENELLRDFLSETERM